MVEHLSDQDLQSLPRGGHDYRKLYAAYRLAVEHKGSPTVILAKTVKGWALGTGLEARNATHQIKDLDPEQLKTFRDRLQLPISDADIEDGDPPYYHPGTDSPEYEYLMARRQALAGPMPTRVVRAKPVPMPPPDTFADFLAGTGEKVQASTTTAFAPACSATCCVTRGSARASCRSSPTRRARSAWTRCSASSRSTRRSARQYEPVDAALLLSYTEAHDGRILEEGITEAGSMASTTAAGTAYATWGQPMIPFFIFYSMFGFQRVGDLIWSFGDQRGRGFLLGATAGRTTLTGEGLQHCDGQSQVLSTTVPNCRAYDPAFAYEVAVLIREGIERMYGENAEDVFYYLTLYNENYSMPPMPTGVEDGIVRGLYRYAEAPEQKKNRTQLLASGSAMLAALEAQQLLADEFDVAADVWSATSYKLLREDALEVERWNRLHPEEPARVPYVTDSCATRAARSSPSPTS